MDKLLEFTAMLNRFREIERNTYTRPEERQEGDAEHSYQLAMLAWYLAERDGLNLDTTKLIRYALIHDLVEVYAGDTYTYSVDRGHLESKAARESAALERLKEEFTETGDIWERVETYEQKEDDESRFIYALDKLVPILNMYLDGGRGWRERGISLAMIREKKAEKVALSPPIQKIFDELMGILEQEEPHFFLDRNRDAS